MKTTRFLPFILPLFLTACANNTVSDSSTSSANSSQSITTTSEVSSVPQTSATDRTDINDSSTATNSELIGICGEKFSSEDFEERPDYVLNEHLYCSKEYGYTALFDGNTYNSVDNPDKFNMDEWACTEPCEAASGGFFAIKAGDKIGDLTCTEAGAEYYLNTAYSDYPAFGLMSSTVSFEGEIEVTGYIDRYDGNEGYVEEGELVFYPDGESWQGLPVPYAVTSSYDNTINQTYSLKDERLIYVPFCMSLGTVFDYSDIDLESEIPEGSTVHMKLVLEDIQLKYVNTDFGGYAVSKAAVVSAEMID